MRHKETTNGTNHWCFVGESNKKQFNMYCFCRCAFGKPGVPSRAIVYCRFLFKQNTFPNLTTFKSPIFLSKKSEHPGKGFCHISQMDLPIFHLLLHLSRLVWPAFQSHQLASFHIPSLPCLTSRTTRKHKLGKQKMSSLYIQVSPILHPNLNELENYLVVCRLRSSWLTIV